MKCFVFPLPPPGMWNSEPDPNIIWITWLPRPRTASHPIFSIYFILQSAVPAAVQCPVPGADRIEWLVIFMLMPGWYHHLSGGRGPAWSVPIFMWREQTQPRHPAACCLYSIVESYWRVSNTRKGQTGPFLLYRKSEPVFFLLVANAI